MTVRETRGLTTTRERLRGGSWPREMGMLRPATVDEALAGILDVASGLSREDSEALVLAFTSEHRTNQQAFVRSVILPILRKLAADGDAGEPGGYDLRNEGAVKFAQAALAAQDEQRIGLPLI